MCQQLIRKVFAFRIMNLSVYGTLHADTNMSVPFAQDHIQLSNVIKGTWPYNHTETTPTKAHTPVNLGNMLQWLGKYPNKVKANFLIQGFYSGFPLPSFLG